jgi:hypothetical protein
LARYLRFQLTGYRLSSVKLTGLSFLILETLSLSHMTPSLVRRERGDRGQAQPADLAIHANMALAEAQTGAGIYVAAQKQHLEQRVREKPGNYRLFIGHAAWASGLLDQEIEAGVWHVLPATAEMVFGVDADLWPLLIRRATGSTLARLVGAPDNPVATALN